MSKAVEFYFDLGSPTAYLAYKELKKLKTEQGVEVICQPILLGGVFKATNNSAPATVPLKGRYLLMHDLPRFIKRYNVPFKMNPNFPVNTLLAMRGCFAAKALDVLDTYVDVMFDAMWVNGLDISDPQIVKEVLSEADIDADKLLSLTSEESIKEQLKQHTSNAVKKGCFGAPTMFVGQEMFFGQDRLDFVKEALLSS